MEDRTADQGPDLGGFTPLGLVHDVGCDPRRSLIVQAVGGVGDHRGPVQVQHPRLQRVQDRRGSGGHLHRLSDPVLRRPAGRRQDQGDLVGDELPERMTRGDRPVPG